MRVLVAEDTPRMSHLLERALRNEGYAVSLAADGEEALNIGIGGGLDVIVLSVMLQRRNGFDVIRSLRAAKCTVPTIMVSPHNTVSDIVAGLDCGADDYLTKPFALDVLLARIRALARRGNTLPADLRFEDLVLNPRTRELRRANRVAALTKTEYAIAEILVRRAGCVVTREALMDAGWGGGRDVSDGTLSVFICALRAKIAQPGEKQFLYTVRGMGYTLRSEDL